MTAEAANTASVPIRGTGRYLVFGGFIFVVNERFGERICWRQGGKNLHSNGQYWYWHWWNYQLLLNNYKNASLWKRKKHCQQLSTVVVCRPNTHQTYCWCQHHNPHQPTVHPMSGILAQVSLTLWLTPPTLPVHRRCSSGCRWFETLSFRLDHDAAIRVLLTVYMCQEYILVALTGRYVQQHLPVRTLCRPLRERGWFELFPLAVLLPPVWIFNNKKKKKPGLLNSHSSPKHMTLKRQQWTTEYRHTSSREIYAAKVDM